MSTHPVLALLLVASAGLVLEAAPPEAQATWRSAELTIDGNDTDWPDAAPVLIAGGLAASVANDEEYLYLRVRATDRLAAARLLYGGLTVWIDRNGGEKRSVGVRYPVGTRLPDPASRRGGQGNAGPLDAPSSTDPAATAGQRNGASRPLPDPGEIVPARVEFLGPGKDDVRSLVVEHLPAGVAVGLARAQDALVYELRLPLVTSPDRPVAVGASPGARLGVGLETGKIERPAARDRPGGGLGGGRAGGRRGGMGRPGGGDRREGAAQARDLFTPVKAWARVQLAQPR